MIVVNPTGGGLSNGKLAQATATPADVLSGKTFFAGGREMQTGTLVTPKEKSGTTTEIDPDKSKTIACGFSPKIIAIYMQDDYRDFYGTVAVWYGGRSYMCTHNTWEDLEWGSTKRIVVSSNSFTISNSVIETYNGNIYPFSGGDIHYVAIG